MNKVYREYFPADPPARYCIRADLVKPEFLVEIASIAHLKGVTGFAVRLSSHAPCLNPSPGGEAALRLHRPRGPAALP